MSTEAPKKRGRPKKVMPELSATEMAEVMQMQLPSKKEKVSKTSIPRTISTKTTPVVKKASTAASKPKTTTTTTPKTIEAKVAKVQTLSTSTASTTKSAVKTSITSTTPKVEAQIITPSTSKILQALAEQNKPEPKTEKSKTVISASTSTASKDIPKSTSHLPPRPPQSTPKSPISKPDSPSPSESKTTKAPKNPLLDPKKMNAFVVGSYGRPPASEGVVGGSAGGIGGGVAARPPLGGNEIPKNYNRAARRVTLVIVALPIAIVTSYFLYQRGKSHILILESRLYLRFGALLIRHTTVILGEEQKTFNTPLEQRKADMEEEISGSTKK
jgi:hypothetical protein